MFREVRPPTHIVGVNSTAFFAINSSEKRAVKLSYSINVFDIVVEILFKRGYF